MNRLGRFIDPSRPVLTAVSLACAIAGSTAILLWLSFLAARGIAGPGADLAGWVQGIGTILAIVAALVIAGADILMRRQDAASELQSLGRTAHRLSYEAFSLVGDRLDRALLPDKRTSLYALHGLRTTEMVAAMREFDTAHLPSLMVAEFIVLRSIVHAINGRITEIYEAEDRLPPDERASLKSGRTERLASCVRVYHDGVATYGELNRLSQKHFGSRHDLAAHAGIPKPASAAAGPRPR